MSKQIDKVARELVAAGYDPGEIMDSVARAVTALDEEKRKKEQEEKAKQVRQVKVDAARDRLVAAFSDYVIAMGACEAFGMDAAEVAEQCKDVIESLEGEIQMSLRAIQARKQMVHSVDDEKMRQFLKQIGVL